MLRAAQAAACPVPPARACGGHAGAAVGPIVERAKKQKARPCSLREKGEPGEPGQGHAGA